MPEEKNTFVNVDFANFPELLESLERMVRDDGMNRSQFIRKLVRQEYASRLQQQIPLPSPEGESAVKKTAPRQSKPRADMAVAT